MTDAQEKLAALQAERNTVASIRTKEDVRSLAESWLAAALGQVNGSAGYILNGHIGPAEVQAVISEYLLESGALVDHIIKKTEGRAELTDRQKSGRLKRLDAEIATAEAVVRKEARDAAIAEIEAQFGGVAA